MRWQCSVKSGFSNSDPFLKVKPRCAACRRPYPRDAGIPLHFCCSCISIFYHRVPSNQGLRPSHPLAFPSPSLISSHFSVGMRGYPKHLTEWCKSVLWLHTYFLMEGFSPALAFTAVHWCVWLHIRVEKGGFGASQPVTLQISRCWVLPVTCPLTPLSNNLLFGFALRPVQGKTANTSTKCLVPLPVLAVMSVAASCKFTCSSSKHCQIFTRDCLSWLLPTIS